MIHPTTIPNNADIRETFTIPGASTIYVSFHPKTKTEEEYDKLEILWPSRTAQEKIHHLVIEQKNEGPYSGSSEQFPGREISPLQIQSDSFDIHFTSDNSNTYWGYRFVVWSQAPKNWCHFSNLVVSEKEEDAKFCKLLFEAWPEFKEYAEGKMMQLLFNMFVNSPDNTSLLVVRALERTGIKSVIHLCDNVIDILLTEYVKGRSNWSHLLEVALKTDHVNDCFTMQELIDWLKPHPRLLGSI